MSVSQIVRRIPRIETERWWAYITAGVLLDPVGGECMRSICGERVTLSICVELIEGKMIIIRAYNICSYSCLFSTLATLPSALPSSLFFSQPC